MHSSSDSPDAVPRRVIRSAGFPDFAAHEASTSARHRKVIALPGGDGIEIRYRSERWENVIPGYGTKRRAVFAWISVAGRKVGALTVVAYDLKSWAIRSEIFEAMDAIAEHEMRLAIVLLSAWPDLAQDVGAFGPIVALEKLWIERGCITVERWSDGIRLFLKSAFPNMALLVAHAFPLEYEHGEAAVSQHWAAFRRRQMALIRLYGRLGGFRPFPGPPAEKGWLWHVPEPLDQHIRPPSYDGAWISAEC